MPAISLGWDLRVERGPDGLWVHVVPCDEERLAGPPLAEEIWRLLERHFVYRLVLELEEVDLLDSSLLGQLVALQKRIREHGGMLRLSGLKAYNQEVLRVHGLRGRLPVYGDLEDAVMGAFPGHPR